MSSITKVAHTPGPWSQGYCGREVWIGSPHDLVAIVERIGPYEEYLANARLIAAAPEMLEILESLVNNKNAGITEIIPYTLEKAKAAIHKARGGQ